ncbi:MAG: hypothetical protein ACOZE7_02575, partial [Pseudomonadota bacterium]
PKDEKQASGTTLIHSQPSQVGQQPWLKIQSARWLNFESAPTGLGSSWLSVVLGCTVGHGGRIPAPPAALPKPDGT